MTLGIFNSEIPHNIAVLLPSSCVSTRLTPTSVTCSVTRCTMPWPENTQVALHPAHFPVQNSIGPTADLPIVNAVVSPDGFTKS